LTIKFPENLAVNYRFGVDNFSYELKNFRELEPVRRPAQIPPSGGAISIFKSKGKSINSKFNF